MGARERRTRTAHASGLGLLVFERGRLYRRAELHEAWGGDTRVQAQGGILTPREEPVVLLITAVVGHDFGYTDWRDADGVWHYYGAGQEGDMEWARGNRAVHDHAANGEDLHLFEANPDGLLRYDGQYVCAEYEVRDDVPDVNKNPRRGFIFSLVPLDDAGGGDLSAAPASGPVGSLWALALLELKQRASRGPDQQTAPRGGAWKGVCAE
jgi:5-methylcytosine-specific restriction protein A